MTERLDVRPFAAKPLAAISCGHAACGAAAEWGGLVIVQPNGLSSSHAVYYACGDHPGVLSAAVETWPANGSGRAPRHPVKRYRLPPVEQRAQPGDPLTPVELRVLRLLAAGAYDDQIARTLHVTTRTCRRYFTSALRKLGARTKAHAIAIGIRDGLVSVGGPAQAPHSPAVARTPVSAATEAHGEAGEAQEG